MTLWRTVAISITFGYIAFLVPWTNLIWTTAPRITPKPDEIFLLGQFGIAQLIFISVYFLVGPVWESFKKAHIAAELLLHIKKCGSISKEGQANHS